jgi:outer membrane protein OmpA-like peptidoglycan-associated protein
LVHTRLTAADERSIRLSERGFYMETPLTELSVDLAFDLLGHRRGKIGLISPYVFVGGGIALANPETFFNTANGDASIDKNADVSGPRFVMPMGAGLRLDMKPNLSLAVELAPRATFSDYLDGVSMAGNPDSKDWYGFGTVQLIYKLTATDRDGDGIADLDDACPEIAGTDLAAGCPDRDNDGVADTADACPDIPGAVALAGCPDSDNDGITDADDACPTQSGPASTGGCPDADGDGVVDDLDECPEEAGLAEYDGCPTRDTDQDGIPDGEDECPEEAGTLSNNGCPGKDSDFDGIPDSDDECPNTAGSLANNGCPEAKAGSEAKAREVMDFATRNVRFSTNNDEFLPSAYPILDEVAKVLKEYPGYKLKIAGYTDSRGASAYNLSLSRARAQRCYEYLRNKGIAADRMEYQGFGEANPIADNLTEAGRLQNRRVEFSLLK